MAKMEKYETSKSRVVDEENPEDEDEEMEEPGKVIHVKIFPFFRTQRTFRYGKKRKRSACARRLF